MYVKRYAVDICKRLVVSLLLSTRELCIRINEVEFAVNHFLLNLPNLTRQKSILLLQSTSTLYIKTVTFQRKLGPSNINRVTTGIMFVCCLMYTGGEADQLRVVPCPHPAVYHTEPSDGCLHRLTVGCQRDEAINIDHSCTRQCKTLVTCKIKHLQIFLEPSTSRFYSVDVKCCKNVLFYM